MPLVLRYWTTTRPILLQGQYVSGKQCFTYQQREIAIKFIPIKVSKYRSIFYRLIKKMLLMGNLLLYSYCNPRILRR